MNVNNCIFEEVREQTCGPNGEGTQTLTCNTLGEWVTSPCVLPPECDEGEIRELRCGSRMIEGEQRCQQGEWQTTRPCMLATCQEGTTRPLRCEDGINSGRETCVDGEWILSEYCPAESCENWTTEQLNCIDGTRPGERLCVDGEWVTTLPCLELGCIENDTRTLACGINGRGTREETCLSSTWTETRACNDNDVCKDGASITSACVGSDLGTQRRNCVAGQWYYDACQVNSVDGSTMSNRRASDGIWYVEKPFFCGVKNNGTVVCWGANDHGQLGQGHTNEVSTPVVVPGLTNITQVSVGGSFACALNKAGEVYCWGDNKRGQSAAPAASETTTPVRVTGFGAVDHISAGGDHACAVTRATGSNGRLLYCWGRNNRFQISASTSEILPPTRVVVENSKTSIGHVAAGSEHTCATTEARTEGGTYYPASIYCWGDRTWGQTGSGPDSTTLNTQTKLIIPAGLVVEDINRLQAGLTHTCVNVRGEHDKFYCWGGNSRDQLGGPTMYGHSLTPRTVSTLGTTSGISLAATATCVIRNSTGFAHCFGSNTDGEIGTGDGSFTSTTALTSVFVANIGRISALFSGASMTSANNNEGARFYNTNCAVTQQGHVYCWGQDHGKVVIPNGSGSANASPVQITIP